MQAEAAPWSETRTFYLQNIQGDYYLPVRFNFISLVNRRSIDDDSELSSASAESGVLPVELLGDEPSLNSPKSPDLPSELTMDHGRGFGAMVGQLFSCFSCDLTPSDSSETSLKK